MKIKVREHRMRQLMVLVITRVAIHPVFMHAMQISLLHQRKKNNPFAHERYSRNTKEMPKNMSSKGGLNLVRYRPEILLPSV